MQKRKRKSKKWKWQKYPNLWLVWFEQKIGVFYIHFQFFRETHHYKTYLILYLYSIFNFSIQKNRIWIQKLNTTFWCFYFFWKWIQWHFRKKNQYVGFFNIDLSHQKAHNLSLNCVEFLIEKYKVKKQSKN